MKKYFLFAAVAGMLASCSSESLTAGSDPKIEPTQEERVPIEINVANNASTKATTRGIGTVGDEVGGNNYWQGEKVNVFMFKKGTLDLALEDPSNAASALYDNTVLTTPTSTAQGGTNTDKGLAYEILAGTPDRVQYKYYPVTGNFDFWGYYADDAAGAVTYGATEVTKAFTINGTQDLMVAKAMPTVAQQGIIDDDAFGTDKNRYYSAFAARKNIQPEMSFNHLLTRLTFSVLAGNEKTRGYKETSPGVWTKPADDKAYEGVFVKSIKVRSLKSGEMVVAYTGDPRTLAQLISFTETTPAAAADSAWFDLYGLRDDLTSKTQSLNPLYNDAIFTNWTSNSVMEPLLKWNDGGAGANANWSKIWRPKTVTTTPTPDGDQIGGAILVAPDDSYDIEVELGQYLLDSEDVPAGSGGHPTYKIAYTTFTKTITPTNPETTFKQSYSYNVKMTLYGFEKIEITTKLEPWQKGTAVEFGVE